MRKSFEIKIGLVIIFTALIFTGFAAKLPKSQKGNGNHEIKTAIPQKMECIVQPYYRLRKDGKPGREITVRFGDAKLFGKASIEVTCGKISEMTDLHAVDTGYTACSILLPENTGVSSMAVVKLTLRHEKNTLKGTVSIPPMRYWTVYLYNHSHVDIGYTNTQKNVEILHKTNVLEGIKLGEETSSFPAGARFKWNPEVTWPVERLWISGPTEQEKIQDAIKNGYLCIDASYLNLNTSVCADEELFHAFSFSRKLQGVTGKPMDVFQQFDIPGITWGLIPVMNQEGIKYILSWINGGDRVGNAHNFGIDNFPFWWIGPDGKSKVLFFQPGSYGNSGSMKKGGEVGRPWFGQRDPSKVPAVIKTGKANVDFTQKLSELEKSKYPYDFQVFSWSLWDNNPLDADIPYAVKEWNEKYAYPKIIIAGGHEIMQHIENKYGGKLPIVKGDYTEYWTDGVGTAAGLTALNRNARERMIQTEKLWAMLNLHRIAPRDELDEAWRLIALASEHTWCFENPSEPYFQDAIFEVKKGYFNSADKLSREMFDEALAGVTDKSNGGLGPVEGPAAGGIAVFNTNSWIHGGLITLDKAESLKGNKVVDDQGNEVPSQRLTNGELVFLATGVPAFGSRHYRVIEGNSSFTNGCILKNNVLENGKLRVVVDTRSGNVTGLVDIETGYNYADAGVNGGLNAFRWLPGNIDAPVADSLIQISVVESGPLVVELKIQSQGKGVRSVTRSVRLIAGQPWLELTDVVDKLPLVEKDGIHFGFGFNIPESKTRVDIPWGIMEVEKDQWPQANRNWFTLQRWLDISNDTRGITWCSLDAPVFEYGSMSANNAYGWGNKGNWINKLSPSSTIYSWLMNNHWHTNFPLTQDGPVRFRYRILPHGAYDASLANRFGMEQAQPLVHVAANNNPEITPLVKINNEKVVVSILKATETGKSFILRLRSLSDKNEIVKPELSGKIKSFQKCILEEIPSGNAEESFEITPFGMVTFKLELE